MSEDAQDVVLIVEDEPVILMLLADYLSGLLIGHELVSGLASAGTLNDAQLVMIGAPALCERYQHALRYLGHPADTVLDNTAPTGLWHLALAAGLIDAPL